jgi:hypothetical protein
MNMKLDKIWNIIKQIVFHTEIYFIKNMCVMF